MAKKKKKGWIAKYPKTTMALGAGAAGLAAAAAYFGKKKFSRKDAASKDKNGPLSGIKGNVKRAQFESWFAMAKKANPKATPEQEKVIHDTTLAKFKEKRKERAKGAKVVRKVNQIENRRRRAKGLPPNRITSIK